MVSIDGVEIEDEDSARFKTVYSSGKWDFRYAGYVAVAILLATGMGLLLR